MSKPWNFFNCRSSSMGKLFMNKVEIVKKKLFVVGNVYLILSSALHDSSMTDSRIWHMCFCER